MGSNTPALPFHSLHHKAKHPAKSLRRQVFCCREPHCRRCPLRVLALKIESALEKVAEVDMLA